jgi:hypothetical protein
VRSGGGGGDGEVERDWFAPAGVDEGFLVCRTYLTLLYRHIYRERDRWIYIYVYGYLYLYRFF